MSVFQALSTVSKYPQLAALCTDITGLSKPHSIATTKSWIVPAQSNFSRDCGEFLWSQNSVKHPKPVASFRCERALGNELMNSIVHLWSCHVYNGLVWSTSNLPKLFLDHPCPCFHSITPCIWPATPIFTTRIKSSFGNPDRQNWRAVNILAGSCSFPSGPKSLWVEAFVSRDFVLWTRLVSLSSRATLTVVVPMSIPRMYWQCEWCPFEDIFAFRSGSRCTRRSRKCKTRW